MKSRFWIAAALSIAFVCGLAWSTLLPTQPALAQSAPGGTAGRYQISAYAGTTPGGLGHGCYLVDTATGQVWHSRYGGTAEKVSDKLP